MNHIAMKHNPFLVETEFLINGHSPSESSNITAYGSKRLQLWVEQIFDDLQALFNGSNDFFIEFTGVESDFNDIKEAANNAIQKGMCVELKFNPVAPAEERLEKIKSLINRVSEESPKFADYLANSDLKAKQDFEDALNNDFDAYVVATMSSGKSTFINAVLGQDLLPAANEATTATIAHIFDDKAQGDAFYGKRFDSNGNLIEQNEAVDLAIMKAWNADSETKTITLNGNIRAIKENNNVRLVLTDTPGPNNSQDPEHQRTTLGFIQDSKRNPLIIYVLNATQLGTNDDAQLLRLVADTMSKGGKQSKDRFLFVVNKMDMFDPERGENIEEALNRVKSYLEENGIHDPNLFPVSARMAYLLRKQGELTRAERNDKTNIADLLLEEPSMAFPQYMSVSTAVMSAMQEKAQHDEALQDQSMWRALLNSGLPGVEAVIDEYINKYSFPMRLNRAHLAMTAAIERGMQEAELIKQLEIDEQALSLLQSEIQSLKARRDQGFNTQAYKEQLKQEGRDLPIKVHNELNELENSIKTLLRNIGTKFRGELSISEAESQVNIASQEISFEFHRLINEYEQVFQRSQDLIKQELLEEYQNHIATLFADSKELELPAFQALKHSISAIPFNIEVSKDDTYDKAVVSGYKTVKDSKWYNPFSWGRTREVPIYRDEKFVDLQDLWKSRGKVVRDQFESLKEQAKQRIKEDKDKLVDNYLAFLEGEFSSKFAAILADLEQKVENQTQRENAIAQAKTDIDEISAIKQELEAILLF
ncbi:dynamin family protein [Vibrio cholerae]|uniref:50S ribosome-binding GTPase n=1 Tax=Vibrio cholerae TaxID=666 RepID=A0A5Q6PJE2_VIBCL|nr:dynamin family protein [Vibrio cholerae]EGQ8224801.1 50S ribosome-binding GTPase [Vibrio cholerae]EJL7926876.1 dynamin family protein [Vibrio cholerae]KAA1212359.1 50S ribosome-binding GTPase [Vibrio cholerae]KAA1254945.1 50S ribosome-binding GTPase [Vibrio cholerae]TXZ02206.1 50S ribosome-binding GTPase [Vibrio cholerae]